MMRFGWHLPDDDIEFSSYLDTIKDDARCILDGRVLYQPLHLNAVFKYFGAFSSACAVDVGAHVGFWSYVLCRHFQRVHAFEPSASMRALFRQNIAADNVTLLPVALSDAPGRGSLNSVSGNSGATFVSFGAAGEVECRTLDSYGLSGVGFVKIDVEGAELQVLEGARQTIAASRPLLIVEQKEFGARYGYNTVDVRALLEELGYVLAVQVVKDEIYLPAEMMQK